MYHRPSGEQANNTAITDYNVRGEVTRTRMPHAGTDGQVEYVTTEFAYDEVSNRTKVTTPRGVEAPEAEDATDFIAEPSATS
ncbi:hypothetical protein ABGB17_19375 [Sphaerisporangium sp. B11E5]|uniref:hypothetical protein n=1 Tax=Sphaerisporangium sp. B11E5 TaxID=3153563 RepID=UPI00325E45BA